LQIESLDIRRTASSGQNLIHGERILFSLQFIPDTFAGTIALDAGYLRVKAQRYPLTNESLLHNRGCLHVLTIEQVRIFVEQADLGTQPLKRLRQLATNRSATDDRKPGRTLSKIEDCFVGQVAGFSQSRDRRVRSARAGRDDRPFEPQRLSSDLDRIRTGKASLAQEHIHAKLRKALR